MLLVTKAVGDFLGVRGIADEMIRFNGFPFLEKEDHAFNVSGGFKYSTIYLASLTSALVSRVMRKDLNTLAATRMSVREVGENTYPTAKGHVVDHPSFRGKVNEH